MLYNSLDRVKKKFFASFLRLDNGCWDWTGNISSHGYGRVGYDGKNTYAHIVSWLIHKNELPRDGLFVCHSCDNKRCVNPDHLFLGTNADNIKDATDKGRMTGRSRVISPEGRIRVRQALSEGLSQRAAAKFFGISQTTVSEINRFAHEPQQ